MLKLNCKGVSLIEMLIVIAMLGVIAPVMFTFFIGGINDYARCTNYINQQYRMQDVIRQIRQDVQDAKKVTGITTGDLSPTGAKKLSSIKFTLTLPDADPDSKIEKEWKFEDDSLQLSITKGTDVGEFVKVVKGLDLSISKFEYFEDSSNGEIKQLILHVLPEFNNNISNKAGNVQDEIITEYSVRYKSIEIYP